MMAGTFRALVDAADETFSVILEIKEPVAGDRNVEPLIEGLAGERLRSLVGRPSEAVFVNKIEPVAAGEQIPDRLEVPIENPAWWPGARILSIRSI
jgi:hypothetical protein